MNEAYRRLVDAFGRGWERGDPEEILSVFTADAVFLETPFSDKETGHAAIRRYWTDLPANQAEVTFRSGEIYVAGPWFATEFRCTYRRRPRVRYGRGRLDLLGDARRARRAGLGGECGGGIHVRPEAPGGPEPGRRRRTGRGATRALLRAGPPTRRPPRAGADSARRPDGAGALGRGGAIPRRAAAGNALGGRSAPARLGGPEAARAAAAPWAGARARRGAVAAAGPDDRPRDPSHRRVRVRALDRVGPAAGGRRPRADRPRAGARRVGDGARGARGARGVGVRLFQQPVSGPRPGEHQGHAEVDRAEAG